MIQLYRLLLGLALFISCWDDFSTSAFAQKNGIERWVRTFDTEADYPTGWRLDTNEYDIDAGKLRLCGIEPMTQNVLNSVVSTNVPYAPYMRFRGEVHLTLPVSSMNVVYILLYAYRPPNAGKAQYIALRLGGVERTASLLLCEVQPPTASTSANITDGRILIRAEANLLNRENCHMKYEFIKDRDKGWLMRLWCNVINSDSPTFKGWTDFSTSYVYESGGLAILCRYTKSRRRNIFFDNFSVETSAQPIAPFDPNLPDPSDPVTPDDPIDPVTPDDPTNKEELKVVINELMAKPSSIGAEYIELHNLSTKSVRLGDLAIGLRRDGAITSYSPLKTSHVLPPLGFVALTTSPESVLTAFPSTPSDSIVHISSLPRLADTGFTLILFAHALQPIAVDTAIYDVGRFEKGIKSKSGYSLERINPNHLGNLTKNWFSADKAIKGSPARINTRTQGKLNPDASEPNLPESDDDNKRKAKFRIYSPKALAQMVVKHMKTAEHGCVSFVHTMDGCQIAVLDQAQTLQLSEQMLQHSDFNLADYMRLSPSKDYLWVLYLQSADKRRTRHTTIFRVYR